MKSKKQIVKRIGALLCTLVLVFGCMGSVPYYADVSEEDLVMYDNLMSLDFGIPSGNTSKIVESSVDKPYVVMVAPATESYYSDSLFSCMYLLSSAPIYVQMFENSVGGYTVLLDTDGEWSTYGWKYRGSQSGKWHNMSQGSVNLYMTYSLNDFTRYGSGTQWTPYYSNHNIYYKNTELLFYGSDVPIYDNSLGYLQNVKENRVYDEVPLGENVNDKFTARWYYDDFSTTGIDLTDGNYMINYYQERWLVKGYKTDDVIEKSDRYLLGTYIVQNGYIQTYSEDIESTLAGQGFENWGFFDLLWNKFVTTHHYFQIVNTSTNEVGGYLHIYYTDDNGKFGVEYIGETLDNEGNYDDSGYKEFIDEDNITTDDADAGFTELEQNNEQTLEEWLEDLKGFTTDGLDDMDGADNLGNSLQAYASQVGNVTKGIGALFGVLPDWIVGLLGVSFCCLFVLIVIKVARG